MAENLPYRCVETGQEAAIDYEERTLLHIERATDEIAQFRVICPCCSRTELHPVDLSNTDYDVDLEESTGGYVMRENYVVTQDPDIVGIERYYGVMEDDAVTAQALSDSIERVDEAWYQEMQVMLFPNGLPESIAKYG